MLQSNVSDASTIINVVAAITEVSIFLPMSWWVKNNGMFHDACTRSQFRTMSDPVEDSGYQATDA